MDRDFFPCPGDTFPWQKPEFSRWSDIYRFDVPYLISVFLDCPVR